MTRRPPPRLHGLLASEAPVVAVLRRGPTQWSHGGRWEHGDSYVVVSRLPWLAVLHAFGTCGTWSRGYSFAPAATPASRNASPAEGFGSAAPA